MLKELRISAPLQVMGTGGNMGLGGVGRGGQGTVRGGATLKELRIAAPPASDGTGGITGLAGEGLAYP